jgi:LmbE family N-acetylglucosaminyl deacetylase
VPAARTITVSARDRVLVIAPHPDDESLATGGLLQAAVAAGAAVRVVYVTDGEFNPWAQLAVEGRWPLTPAARARWGALRRRESLRALAELGVPARYVEWLGLPDQHLTDLLAAADDRLPAALAREVHRDRPTLVAVPSSFDRHPDHSAVAVSLAFALARLDPEASGLRVIEYRVHRSRTDPEPACALALHPEQRARKRAAILCHASQLRWHRRQMLAFARDREGFDEFGAPSREPHPIVEAAIDDSTLRVEIAGARVWGLGSLVLRVAIEDDRGAVARFAIPLPGRPAEIEIRNEAGQGARSRARIERTPRGWRVRVALAHPRPASCFVKLERPRERALGFFDDAGWMRARVIPASRHDALASAPERRDRTAAPRRLRR